MSSNTPPTAAKRMSLPYSNSPLHKRKAVFPRNTAFRFLTSKLPSPPNRPVSVISRVARQREVEKSPNSFSPTKNRRRPAAIFTENFNY